MPEVNLLLGAVDHGRNALKRGVSNAIRIASNAGQILESS